MKKPQYKIGDYVEFEYNFGHNKKGFIELECYPNFYRIVTRSGKSYHCFGEEIIRKLPILRDKNGRFVGKTKITKVDISEIRFQVNDKPSTCSCFNCDKCAEQMRAYYEKTGELKPKMGKNWGKIKDSEGNYHEFGEQMPYDSFGSRVKTEEKKPSERISELFKKNRVTGASDALAWCRAIGDYLDEQFEKGKK